MASVMGLLEVREAAARVRAEELRAEADRVLAELGEAEAVLERRVIARLELAEAQAAPVEAGDAPVVGSREVAARGPAGDKAPVAGSIVPRWWEGAGVEALASHYRRIMEALQNEPTAGEEGMSAKELAARLGLELVPAKIEGVRSKTKSLVERGRLTGCVAVGPGYAAAPHRDRSCRVSGCRARRARRRLMSMDADHQMNASLLSGRVSAMTGMIRPGRTAATPATAHVPRRC
ncbi:hypothetical protein HRW23_33095 [Streptomyces lunaelactis]|uniref:hypothetical protein n=1 Tax=Streptomyces lunaelactis TaxID=1535768 RepID=UPI001585120E|nr:hypothetical protein [Streptomyces lunaelactis]